MVSVEFVKKGIYTPTELRNLYTHNYNICRRKTKRVHEIREHFSQKHQINGEHISKPVLDTLPIVTAPVYNQTQYEGEMVLNGKHRATSALFKGTSLEYRLVESKEDVLQGVSPELAQGLAVPTVPGDAPRELRQLVYFFNNRHRYLRTVKNKKLTIEDHLKEYELHIKPQI